MDASPPPLPSPLAGILVIEVANFIAGPCCGAMLADMGAEVVKIEPRTGDIMRYVIRQPRDRATGKAQQNGEFIDTSFTLNNRGAKSLCVDLRTRTGQQLVRRLAAKADVFLTNLLPVRLTRFGLDWPTLSGLNSRLVYASVSGWGLKGPGKDDLAFDTTAFFARGGVISLQGAEGTAPVKPRPGQGDHQTGLAALSSVLAALLLRGKTGRGSLCEASLNRTATWNISEDLSAALVDGFQPQRYEEANSDPLTRLYETKDQRWIVIQMPSRQDYYWPRFCAALGRGGGGGEVDNNKGAEEEWLSASGAFASARARYRARRDLGARVAAIMKTDTLESWLARLKHHGCIAGPVSTLPEVCADRQLRENGAFHRVHHPVAGSFDTIASPFQIHGADVRPRGVGPDLGVDTDAVLSKVLGLTAPEIDELRKAGVVGAAPVPNSPIANWVAKL